MTETTKKPKASRLTRGLLIGSLTLNFLIIGGGVGLVLSSANHRHPPPSSFTIGPFTRALEEGQRVSVRENLKGRMEARRFDDRKENRRAYFALLAALRQDPFDRSAVVKELESMEKQGAARRTQGADALLDAIEAMTPEERSAYVDRLESDLKKKRSGSRKGAKHDK